MVLTNADKISRLYTDFEEQAHTYLIINRNGFNKHIYKNYKQFL